MREEPVEELRRPAGAEVEGGKERTPAAVHPSPEKLAVTQITEGVNE